jgi:hypothetical protein
MTHEQAQRMVEERLKEERERQRLEAERRDRQTAQRISELQAKLAQANERATQNEQQQERFKQDARDTLLHLAGEVAKVKSEQNRRALPEASEEKNVTPPKRAKTNDAPPPPQRRWKNVNEYLASPESQQAELWTPPTHETLMPPPPQPTAMRSEPIYYEPSRRANTMYPIPHQMHEEDMGFLTMIGEFARTIWTMFKVFVVTGIVALVIAGVTFGAMWAAENPKTAMAISGILVVTLLWAIISLLDGDWFGVFKPLMVGLILIAFTLLISTAANSYNKERETERPARLNL